MYHMSLKPPPFSSAKLEFHALHVAEEGCGYSQTQIINSLKSSVSYNFCVFSNAMYGS